MLRSPVFQKIPRFLPESFLGSVLLVLLFWNFQSKQIIWFTADSGTYLLNSLELKVPGDRTVFYSLFIAVLRFFFELLHWRSLFPVVFIPLWLVVYASMHTFFKLSPKRICHYKYWISILATLSGIWFSGALWIFLQVMPDGFTSIMFLSSILWMYSIEENRKSAAWFWGVVAVFSAVMHNGNLIPFTGIILLNIMFKLIITNDYYKERYNLKITFSLLPWILILLSNFVGGNGWTFSKNAPVFLIAKMSENGVLIKYLDKNCSRENHPICEFKGQLPDHAWDFIWRGDGIHMKLGGWYHTDSLYRTTIKHILTDQSMLAFCIKAGFLDTWKQLFLWGVGDGVINASQNETISKYAREFYDFEDKVGCQTDFTDFNSVSGNFAWVLCVLCILLFAVREKSVWSERALVGFFALLIGFCVLQAFSTGALANILTRLNMRAVWYFLPLMLFFVLSELIQIIQSIRVWFFKKNC